MIDLNNLFPELFTLVLCAVVAQGEMRNFVNEYTKSLIAIVLVSWYD